jgi:hypothetical protein
VLLWHGIARKLKQPPLFFSRLDLFYKFVTLCGLRVLNVGENWMEIDISDIYDESDDTSILVLTVHFAESETAVLIEDVTVGS